MTRLILIAALLLAVLAARPAGVTHAAGNADAAHACQQTGYLTLFRADGTGFKNAGECTSYAAHGGQFSSGIAACAVGSNSGCVTLTNVTLDGINGFTGSYTLTGLYDFSPTQTNCDVVDINQCAPSTGGGTYTTTWGDAGTFSVLETVNTQYTSFPCTASTVGIVVVSATFTSTMGYPATTFYLLVGQPGVALYTTDPIEAVYWQSSTSPRTSMIDC